MKTNVNYNMQPIIGAMVGAIISVAAFLYIFGPGKNFTLAAIAVLGGGALGGFLVLQYINKNTFLEVHGYQDEVKIPLREEHINIIKKKVSTGDIKIHKEVITERQTVTMPISREEIVIETVKGEGLPNEKPRTIRIPLRKEKLNITKTVVALNDVSVFKNSIHETKQINTTLKKETVKVEDK